MFDNFDNKADVVAVLNRILESELAGVVRYTHYSFMIFGHQRIPIVAWMRSEATTSLHHAQEAGEFAVDEGRQYRRRPTDARQDRRR